MTTLLRSHAFAALFAALVLAGCATPPAAPLAEPAGSPSFRHAEAAPAEGRWTALSAAALPADGAWWRVFGDPALDALVAQAAAANGDIVVAQARIAQARALVRATDARRAPQLGAQAGVGRATEAGAGPGAATLGQVGLAASYEVDLFGRLARATSAAEADLAAREALAQGTRLVVQSEVAQAWLAWRSLHDEQRLLAETLASYQASSRLIGRRYQAGDVAELDVARIDGEVAATEAQQLAVERAAVKLEHAIAVLVGADPSAFRLAEPDTPATAAVVPAGLPSAVLARRPDLQAARHELAAAQARLGVAQQAWLPSVALTAQGGVASTELGDLFRWSARSWGIGLLLDLPLFDGGRRAAGVASAQAELDAAAARYRQQVLGAFRDVEDQLAELSLLDRQQAAQQRALEAASQAAKLSDSRYRSGFVSQLEALDARRTELARKREAVQLAGARQQATVGLVRAIGGAWG